MSTDISPDRDTVVDRIWSVAASLEGIGLALLVAGGTLVVEAVASTKGGGWLEPLRLPAVVPFIAGLLAGAAVLWVGVIWQRYFETDVADTGERSSRLTNRTLPTVGATGMLAGAAAMVAVWFVVQAAGPSGTVVLSAGDQTEAFESRIAGEELEVMLPLRLHLEDLELEGAPAVDVAFSTPDRDPFGQRRLMSGEAVNIEGYRVAPIGLSTRQGSLQATIRSRREKTIAATVGEGESFRLSPEGPRYQVRKIIRNYMDAVGPAVRLESETHGEFVVFTENESATRRPDFGHDLYVDSLQKAPGVLFAVTPGFPLWAIGAGGTLFIFGLAVVLAFPERVRRRFGPNRDRESFNEAGALVEGDVGDGEAQ